MSILTLIPGGSIPLPPGSLLSFAKQLGAALAMAEGGSVSVVTKAYMEEVLGEGSAVALELSYGRGRASAWLSSVEECARFTILVAENAPSPAADSRTSLPLQSQQKNASNEEGGDPFLNWARLCTQHSDVVLVVGEGGGHPAFGRLESTLLFSPQGGAMHLARVDLVLLHAPNTPPSGTRAWFSSQYSSAMVANPSSIKQQGMASSLTSTTPPTAAAAAATWTRGITHHHHVRQGCQVEMEGDIARLARILTGRAVGVVLGGGGSRGLAHLGLLRELHSRGIPIDCIGGASQGCFMAAAWAISENLESMEAKVAALSDSVGSTLNIIRALTLPLVSLTSGAHFDDIIRSGLGCVQIEDIPGPRFFAVSLNATDGALAVHAVGPLWRYVRASMSVIKLLPPVFDRETKRLLVDGGYVSNLPVDVLHALFPGTVGLVFACDVENKDSTANWLDIRESDYGLGDSLELSGWWVAWRALLSFLRLGPPMRMPYTDDLFLQVSYMMHYSRLRALLSEEGYDGAMKEREEEEGEEEGGGEGGGGTG